MPETKLLITGATGYIGGSILTTLLNTSNPAIKALKISALVRGEERAAALEKLGVTAILFTSLDDWELLTKVASQHDIVINTASAFHTGAARALISGLAHRKKETGNAVHYIHTTGTSSLGDNQIGRSYIEPRILSDKDVHPSTIFTYLRFRESLEPYGQRTTDIAAVDKGVDVDVPTYLLMSPTIYGRGTGAFNKRSIQIPGLVRHAVALGYVPVLGKGDGAWDAVHIDDLVLVYELFVSKILAGEDKDLPSGEKGIYFTETGDFTWRALSEGVARELLARGAVKSDEVKEMSLEEFAAIFSGGDGQYSELGFASTARSRADLTRELGWRPRHRRWDFFEGIKGEVEAVLGAGK